MTESMENNDQYNAHYRDDYIRGIILVIFNIIYLRS